MKENKAKIKGDGNMVFQDIKKSEIHTAKGKDKKKRNSSTIVGIVIALLTLIVTVIIGWDEIITFLGV